ncbi:MAG: macro domain-containing protein [Sphaerochaetaceae bacterium]|nr:macro domain-containing protein [Sphaerochaetaceae bacterium]
MIKYLEGDLFKSPAQVIVNTVNTVGVMGKGIALEYKKRYPEMFDAYKKNCDKNRLKIGKLMLWYAPDHWILLFPTKEHWRRPSKLDYIEAGLMKFADTYADKHILSIAFPRLGCGNGELNWEDVRPLMEKYLKPLPIDVYIYLKNGGSQEPEHKHQKETMKWLRANAKDMSFNGVKDDIINSRPDLFNYYQFMHEGAKWTVAWEDGCVFSQVDNPEKVIVSEDDLMAIWDEIQETPVFSKITKNEKANLFFSLLDSLGYLSRIKLYDRKLSAMVEGYQLNEGMGRTFTLTE